MPRTRGPCFFALTALVAACRIGEAGPENTGTTTGLSTSTGTEGRSEAITGSATATDSGSNSGVQTSTQTGTGTGEPAATDTGSDTSTGTFANAMPQDPCAPAAPDQRVVVHENEYLPAGDTVWSAGDGPHLVIGRLQIVGGSRLLLEPGAQVWLTDGAFIDVQDAGSLLQARGTGDRPVLFRSNMGCFENGGSWGGIDVWSPAVADLQHVRMVQGGGGDDGTYNGTLIGRGEMFSPLSSPLLLNNVQIQHSRSHGIVLMDHAGFAPGSSGLVIENSGLSGQQLEPVRLPVSAVGTLPSGRYTGNVRDEVLVDVDDPHDDGYVALLESVEVRDQGVPYRIGTQDGAVLRVGDDNPSAPAANLPTLIVGPEVTLRFQPSGGLLVGWTASQEREEGGAPAPGAALRVAGTAARPAVFESATSGRPGDWGGVQFLGGVAPSTSLQNLVVRHAGAPVVAGFSDMTGADQCPVAAALAIIGAPPSPRFLSSVTLQDFAGSGIHVAWPAPEEAEEPVQVPLTKNVSFKPSSGGQCRQTKPMDIQISCDVVCDP